MTTPNVIFNGSVLNTLPGVTIEYYDANQTPEMDILQYKIARGDRSVITNKSPYQKKIPVYAVVCNGNRAGTELTLAILRLSFLSVSGRLDLEQLGVRTVYEATCTEMNVEFNGKIAYLTMIFTATTPFGVSDISNLTTIPTITTASSTFTVSGTSTTQIKPQINLEFTSVTGGTAQTVSIRNANTNQGISITNDFATSDVLYIDSEAMSVLLNGAPVDFTGTFPTWTPTIAAFLTDEVVVDYVDSFSARSVTGTFNFPTRV